MKNEKTKLYYEVKKHYRSVEAFCEDIHWSYPKAYRIITGKQTPNIFDAFLMADKIGIKTAEKMREVFLDG